MLRICGTIGLNQCRRFARALSNQKLTSEGLSADSTLPAPCNRPSIGSVMSVSSVDALDRTRHVKYERLIARAKEVPAARTAVVHPCDETSLRGVVEAAEAGIIIPILVGPTAKIAAVAREHKLDIKPFQMVDTPHSEAAAAKAVELVREAKSELLMKGSLHTDELMSDRRP
jgi:phosphotransacetylase